MWAALGRASGLLTPPALQASIPFAVIGSNATEMVDGVPTRVRRYPWGVVDIENETHCDFTKLRDMIVRTHMEELKDRTHEELYERYRTEALSRGAR